RYSAREPAAAARHPRARRLRAWVLDTMGRTMEHITVAGHPEPIPASEVAATLLRQRLETVRQERGADAAATLGGLIGPRRGARPRRGAPRTTARPRAAPTPPPPRRSPRRAPGSGWRPYARRAEPTRAPPSQD